MKPIEINPIARSRPVGTDAARTISDARVRPGSADTPQPEPGMVTRSDALSAGPTPPVNTDRVTQIRTAIKDGSYPLVPTKVADAMIAASYMLIEGTKDQ